MDRYDLVITNGLVVSHRDVQQKDVAIAGEKVVAVDDNINLAKADRVVDATGKHLIPGGIDPHVHFGIPMGWTHSADDYYWGSQAAVCGGVTTVIDFTEQLPTEDLLTSINRRQAKAENEGSFCDYSLHANVTSPTAQVLSQIPDAIDMGVASFKTFLAYPKNMIPVETLSEIAVIATRHGGLVMVHSEVEEIIAQATQKLIDQGKTHARYFFDSRPVEAEVEAIKILGVISRANNVPFYIVHLSSKAGYDEAIYQNQQGALLLIETCPHYLFLSVRPVMPQNPHLLVASPPLRSTKDNEGLLKAVIEGEVKTMGTDHCPFTIEQKRKYINDFTKIPGGLPGVENIIPLMYHLALTNKISLQRMVELVSYNPARVFGLDTKGEIAVGKDADITILDPDGSFTIHHGNMHSNTDYTPYEGMNLSGRIHSVYLRGKLVARYREGKVEVVHPPKGRFVKAKTPLKINEVIE